MNKKVAVLFCLVAVLILASLVEAASNNYRMPTKRVGLSLGVNKENALTKKVNPCAKLGCNQWHYAIGDKNSKKAYRCTFSVVLPSSLTKDSRICFGSAAAAKRLGYKVEESSRRYN